MEKLSYFLTLTFRRTFHSTDYKVLFYKTISGLLKQLNVCSPKYKLVPELTMNGVLHYHILLNISDYIKFKILINYWNKTYGYVDKQPLKHMFESFLYIRKDTNEMMRSITGEHDELSCIITKETSKRFMDRYCNLLEQDIKTIQKALKQKMPKVVTNGYSARVTCTKKLQIKVETVKKITDWF